MAAEQLHPLNMLPLRQWLDEKLAEYEDQLVLAHPRIMGEIREARVEYEAGEYVKSNASAHWTLMGSEVGGGR